MVFIGMLEVVHVHAFWFDRLMILRLRGMYFENIRFLRGAKGKNKGGDLFKMVKANELI